MFVNVVNGYFVVCLNEIDLINHDLTFGHELESKSSRHWHSKTGRRKYTKINPVPGEHSNVL